MTVTLADVAARARVSPATVSRVLNGNYPVAASTRDRVLRAVSELDYVLNGPASSLAAATSDLVGILVNDIADPFFGVMAGAVQTAVGEDTSARGGGEKLAVVCNTNGVPERELTYLTLLQRQRAAAVVITGGAPEDPDHAEAMTAKLSRLADAGTTVVLCGRPPMPGAGVTAALSFDDRAGGRLLTE
ncbi:LacI family DNA-binding transcriptional regulator, partial [Streptomyces sparsus]